MSTGEQVTTVDSILAPSGSASAEPLGIPSPTARPLRAGLGSSALTRRNLLALAALAAAARVLPFGTTPAAGGRSAFERASYAPLVGQRLTLRGAGAPALGVRLVELGDLAGAGAGGGFSLLLHGPRSPRLEQGMYELRHPTLSHAPLLVVPAGSGRRGQDYEVIINSAAPSAARR